MVQLTEIRWWIHFARCIQFRTHKFNKIIRLSQVLVTAQAMLLTINKIEET